MTTPPPPPGLPASPVYVQPMYAVPQPKGFSVTSLVLALISIFFGFTVLVPLLSLVFGIIGAAKEPAGRGMAVAGIVISAIFLVGWLLVVLLLIGSLGLLGLGAAFVAPQMS